MEVHWTWSLSFTSKLYVRFRHTKSACMNSLWSSSFMNPHEWICYVHKVSSMNPFVWIYYIHEVSSMNSHVWVCHIYESSYTSSHVWVYHIYEFSSTSSHVWVRMKESAGLSVKLIWKDSLSLSLSVRWVLY